MYEQTGSVPDRGVRHASGSHCRCCWLQVSRLWGVNTVATSNMTRGQPHRPNLRSSSQVCSVSSATPVHAECRVSSSPSSVCRTQRRSNPSLCACLQQVGTAC